MLNVDVLIHLKIYLNACLLIEDLKINFELTFDEIGQFHIFLHTIDGFLSN